MNITTHPASEWTPGALGIFTDLPPEKYHTEAAGLSRSMGEDLVFRSPAHMREAMDNPEPPTAFMAVGTVVHCAALEPERLLESFYIRPDEYPAKDGPKAWSGNSNWCKDWLEKHSDKPVLTRAEMDNALGCLDAIQAHPMLAAALNNGLAEVSVFAESTEPVLLRCRPDLLAEDSESRLWVFDLKKCQDASPAGFTRHARAMRYDFQAAWYLHTLRLAGLEPWKFIFAAVEEQPPHGLALYEIGNDVVAAQAPNVARAVELYAQCSEQNHWPGYPEQIEGIGWRVGV